MDTSDSEHFESADEDFYSEDEKETSVIESKNFLKNENFDTKLSDKVCNLTIHEKSASNTKENDVSTNTILKDKEFSKVVDIDYEKTKSEVKEKDTNTLNEHLSECDFQQTKNLKSEKVETDDRIMKNVSEEECLWSSEEIAWNMITEDDKSKVICEEITKNEKDSLWEDDELIWEEEANKELLNMQDKKNMNENDNFQTTLSLQHNTEVPDTTWDGNDWEPLDNIEDKTRTNENDKMSTWESWGTWGVSSLLNTASTLTTQVSQSISTALETGIGVPDPEEMAKINHLIKDQAKEEIAETSEHNMPVSFGLGNLGNIMQGVSHLTKFVESTGTKVISGGLDTLETIGKKTMEVLQEGDPGLKKKRAFLKLDQGKPVLSQVLREAKERAEKENSSHEIKQVSKKVKNYESIFDDYNGLVHLEALEMLSKQCDIKLQTLGESLESDAIKEMQETLDQVKELCELPDDDEDEQISIDEVKDRLETNVSEMNIKISYSKLISKWEETIAWLSNLKLDFCDERELHQQAIETLAQLTAIAVELFHKTGELLLIKEHRSTADEADSLVQLTTTLKSLMLIVANKFTERLHSKVAEKSNKEEVNNLITNVFFEAANSSRYIQNAFQLLIPVLQVGAV